MHDLALKEPVKGIQRVPFLFLSNHFPGAQRATSAVEFNIDVVNVKITKAVNVPLQSTIHHVFKPGSLVYEAGDTVILYFCYTCGYQ